MWQPWVRWPLLWRRGLRLFIHLLYQPRSKCFSSINTEYRRTQGDALEHILGFASDQDCDISWCDMLLSQAFNLSLSEESADLRKRRSCSRLLCAKKMSLRTMSYLKTMSTCKCQAHVMSRGSCPVTQALSSLVS